MMKPLFSLFAFINLLVCVPLANADELDLPPGITNSQNPKDVPLKPEEAVKKVTLPEGFKVTLFAGEPAVRQPIAFTHDDRGRLWVAECYSYRTWAAEGKDRILIFEDTDNDGRYDKRKIFWAEGNYLTGLVTGFGGVYVCCTPHFMFIPDRDGDDKPDGPPEVLLDGWSTKGVHNVLNALIWGPDGWLYGCNGITAPSKVGKPGTPDEKRVEINCGIWRYHPTRREFEVVAHGTTNPWGLDFDEHGQGFFTNCVIAHLWHLIPGAHYKRMFGQDIDSHSYGLLDSCSDHLHWVGSDWTKARGGKGEHDAPGGGHAHAGCMIYLGNNWPDKYRGTLFTCNIHGNRVNNDLLSRQGSGYIGKHGKDFFLANDEWFRGLECKYGPDGGVYVSDWTDLGECHDNDGVHRDSGRIYKVTYGTPAKLATFDLAKSSDEELVKLLLHKNEWHARHARRLLQERASAGMLGASVNEKLLAMYRDEAAVPMKLRALWTLYATGGTTPEFLISQLTHESEHVRWWALRLLSNSPDWCTADVNKKLKSLAAEGQSPLVRLGLASALQRIPRADRWPIAEALVSHAEDADDANLPLMIWYGIEPLVSADGKRAVTLAAKSKIPLVRQYLARRIAEK